MKDIGLTVVTAAWVIVTIILAGMAWRHRRQLAAWWHWNVPGPDRSARAFSPPLTVLSRPDSGPGTTIAIRDRTTAPLFDPRRDWQPPPIPYITSGPRVRPEMRGQWTAISGTWKQDTMRALEAGWSDAA